jgi:murein DD-endopeptidase MepM/ murein hydrolase activator NlpD
MRRSSVPVILLALALLMPLSNTGTVRASNTGTVRAAGGAIEAVSGSVQATQQARRLRLVPPVNFPMATSPRCYILDNFGDARSGGRSHQGSDMMATLGQEVYAMANGTLTYQSKVGDGRSGTSLSGNLWELTADDGTGTYYTYAHLSGFAPELELGSTVFDGQLIGYVGDTGNPGTGNYHLHFEIHPNGGAAVNPLPLVTIPPTCSVY